MPFELKQNRRIGSKWPRLGAARYLENAAFFLTVIKVRLHIARVITPI